MRLIDADRLKAVLEKNFGHTGGASVLEQLIDEQPTIQPEKGTTSALISRTETVEHLRRVLEATVPNTDYDEGFIDGVEFGISTVSTMPTIQLAATDTNVGDKISRQDAINAIVNCTNCGDEKTLRAYVAKHHLDNGWTGGVLEAIDAIEDLPPAHPEERTKERAEMHACDLISRQQAIMDAESWVVVDEYEKHLQKNVVEWLKKFPPAELGVGTDTISRQAAIDALDCINGTEEVLRSLPPAQPEPKEGHWIPHEGIDGDIQYECSRCGVLWEFNDGTPEDNEAYFCPRCGKKLKGV